MPNRKGRNGMYVVFIPKLNCYLSRHTRKGILVCADNIESKRISKFKTFDNALKYAIRVVKPTRFDFEIVNLYDIH